jgi:hypothetical protein
MSHSCLTTIIWTLPVHTTWSLPPLHPFHFSDFRQGWACDWIFHRTPLIQEWPVPESLPSQPSSVSMNANNRHLISHSCLTISNWIMPIHAILTSPPPLPHYALQTGLGLQVYPPPCNPWIRVCRSPNPFNQIVKATRRVERDADFCFANYGTNFQFVGMCVCVPFVSSACDVGSVRIFHQVV